MTVPCPGLGSVTVLDMRDFPLPLFDQDLEAAKGCPENAGHSSNNAGRRRDNTDTPASGNRSGQAEGGGSGQGASEDCAVPMTWRLADSWMNAMTRRRSRFQVGSSSTRTVVS